MSQADKRKCACSAMKVNSQLAKITRLITEPVFRPKWKEALRETNILTRLVDKFSNECDYPKVRGIAKRMQKALIEKDAIAVIQVRFSIWDICKGNVEE